MTGSQQLGAQRQTQETEKQTHTEERDSELSPHRQLFLSASRVPGTGLRHITCRLLARHPAAVLPLHGCPAKPSQGPAQPAAFSTPVLSPELLLLTSCVREDWQMSPVSPIPPLPFPWSPPSPLPSRTTPDLKVCFQAEPCQEPQVPFALE